MLHVQGAMSVRQTVFSFVEPADQRERSRPCFLLFFYFKGGTAEGQRVSECCSVIWFHPVLTSFKSRWSLKDSRLISVRSWRVLELPTRVTGEGKQMSIDKQGNEIRDERRNGLAGQRGEGGWGWVCALYK